MIVLDELEITDEDPILLRRVEKKPNIIIEDVEIDENGYVKTPLASHMTVVTTGGMQPEMHDQTEDTTR